MIFNLKSYAFIFTSFLAISLNAYSEDCLKIANGIIKNDQKATHAKATIPKKFRLKNLPDDQAVFEIQKNAGMDLFNQSRMSFEKIIKQKNADGDDFTDILKALKKEEMIQHLKELPTEKENLLNNLKAIRKQANILRSLFEIYSKDHQCPEQFEKFTKSLGKLNDYLDFDAWKATPDGAKKVAKAFDMDALTKEFNAFELSAPKATKKHLESIRENILDLVNKKNLTVDEFHETRKLLKHFLTIAQLHVEEQPELESSFKFLEELNLKLGLIRDDVLKEEVNAKNKGKKIPDEGYQNIPENFKEHIRNFFANFKIIIE